MTDHDLETEYQRAMETIADNGLDHAFFTMQRVHARMVLAEYTAEHLLAQRRAKERESANA